MHNASTQFCQRAFFLRITRISTTHDSELTQNHLRTTLCTHTDCTSVSHLTCLAEFWLQAECNPVSAPRSASPTPLSSDSSPSPSTHHPFASSRHPLAHLPASASAYKPSTPLSSSAPSSSRFLPSSSAPLPSSSPNPISTSKNLDGDNGKTTTPNPFSLGKGMLPRGGTCISCWRYTLWGDIIKGCYRRHTGRVLVSNNLDDGTLEADEEAEGLKEQEELTAEGFSDSGSRSESSDLLIKQLELLELEGSVSGRAKRGRPTKAKVTINEMSGASPTGRTRRPGRPRRLEAGREPELDLTALPVSTGLKVVQANLNSESEQESKPQQQYMIPRKRGRPKKLIVSIDTTTIATTADPISTKRRPGRPRKITVPECTLSSRKGQDEEVIITATTPSRARSGAGAGAANA